jgi:hypothetical protein
MIKKLTLTVADYQSVYKQSQLPTPQVKMLKVGKGMYKCFIESELSNELDAFQVKSISRTIKMYYQRICWLFKGKSAYMNTV